MQPHASCILRYRHVHVFNHSIFLCSPYNIFLSTNIVSGSIIFKFMTAILTTIIKSKTFSFLTILIFNQVFPFLKSLKYIRFLFKEINPYFSSCIINKCNIIMRATKGRYLSWSPYIYAQVLISPLYFPSQSLQNSLSFVFHTQNFHENPY